jgi:hypothetical protein
MEPRDFAYWLQGFFEVSNAKTLNEEQVAMIRAHLDTLFHKVTFTTTTTFPQPELAPLDTSALPPGLICSPDTKRYC